MCAESVGPVGPTLSQIVLNWRDFFAGFVFHHHNGIGNDSASQANAVTKLNALRFGRFGDRRPGSRCH